MSRVAFLIDGFNLYHSIVKLKKTTGVRAKWLDIYSLCSSYLYLFGKNAQMADIRYFSALAYHLQPSSPDKVQRHQAYILCLQNSGVKVILGRFKDKEVYCTRCQSHFLKHEEKETDVSIAIALFDLFLVGACDIAVVVSGDTDLAPAITACRSHFPTKKIIFAFPFGRKNNELERLAPGSFSIGRKQYINHQFSNPVCLADGRIIQKPQNW